MAEKTARVGFRWRPDVKLALEKAAKSEDRSPSSLAERIIAEWMKKHGWLK
jgi:predicted transcriptional regulator